MHCSMKTLACFGCIVVFPAALSAQAAIGGLVRDLSGAALPGVTVEATSGSLIEKSRTAVTDGAGLYRIENLRPGTYRVVFTRSGLRPHVREGIELTGSLTATADARLEVGLITETMTVVAGTPLVDVHNARHESILSGEDIGAIPSVRSYNALLPFVPGVIINANDIVTGAAATQFPFHGGRPNEGRLSLDGLTIGSPPTGNSPTSYGADVGMAQEIVFSSASAESETAGLVMNIVPKAGGNSTRGFFFAGGTGKNLQADNLTPALKAQGVTAASPLRKAYDFSSALGGPIARDRVWYFVNGHAGGSTKDAAGVYYNLNAGDAAKWLYAPDLNRREYSDRTFENVSGRLTWQLTSRNKIGGFWDEQALCRACTGATPGLSEPALVSPEAVGVLGRPLRVTQVTWSSVLGGRFLIDAGYGGTSFGVGNFERNPNPTRALVRVVEQCANGCAVNGDIPGLVYRSQDFSTAYTGSYLWKASLSHVTGTHRLKIGYQHTLMTDDRTWMTNDQNLTYRFDNGVPNQLTESISPWVNDSRAGWDAIFAQGQWTRRRLTLQGGVRFDRAASWFPAQQEGPARFLPSPIVVAPTTGVDSYKDLTPRLGAALDVFGDGRTAVKLSVGRFLDGVGTSGIYLNTNPTLRMPQTTSVFGTAGVTRTWVDANGNFVPDCDLLSPTAQDMRAAGGDFCGVLSNASFGQNVLSNRFDPRILNGWGVRPSDWNFSIALEQQVGTKGALNIEYTHRSFQGFTVVDNLSLGPSDLTRFNLVAPLDARLPGGGGYTISGLYDVVPAKAGQVTNLITDSSNYGGWFQYFNGVDITANIRNLAGLTLVGGTSTGQTVADNCAVRASLPELSTAASGATAFGPGLVGSVVTPLSPYCHIAFGLLTQLRGLMAYRLPRGDVQVAATFQSKQGAMLSANYTAPNAVVASSLGRNLSASAPNVTVNLVPPGAMYGDRINELDLRVGKRLTLGRKRALLAIDLYNLLNSSAALSYNASFVPNGTWPQAVAILTPRVLRVTAQFEF